jgi:hypothetical protein
MASLDPEEAGRPTRNPAQQPAPEYDSSPVDRSTTLLHHSSFNAPPYTISWVAR